MWLGGQSGKVDLRSDGVHRSLLNQVLLVCPEKGLSFFDGDRTDSASIVTLHAGQSLLLDFTMRHTWDLVQVALPALFRMFRFLSSLAMAE